MSAANVVPPPGIRPCSITAVVCLPPVTTGEAAHSRIRDNQIVPTDPRFAPVGSWSRLDERTKEARPFSRRG